MPKEETKQYMPSALSNLFTTFLHGSHKHDDIIADTMTPQHHTKIEYADFTPELQEAVKTHKEADIHAALFWALQNIIQTSKGLSTMNDLTDKLSFELNAGSRWNGLIFRKPSLVATEDHFTGKHKIDNTANKLQDHYTFCTMRENEEILLWTGKVYDSRKAATIIKEETEQLIPDCTTGNRIEVTNKLKARIYIDRELFDVDSTLITVENGILDLDTSKLAQHTPDNLSTVLIPRNFIEPTHKINEKTVFTDIAKNLRDTKFWKFITTSMTPNGKLQQEDLETILESLAAPLIKRPIDNKAFMHLGKGDNGKSIFLGYFKKLYGGGGGANGSNASLHDLATDKYIPAGLHGKSYNVFADIEKNDLRFSATIKAITGGRYDHSTKETAAPV